MNRPIKAMFIQCARPEWPVVASHLVAEYGWEVCYWVGSRHAEDQIREQFPGAVYHSSRDARTMKVPADMADLAQKPLDEPLIKAMSYHQTVTEKMMERFDLLNNFLFQDKVQHYHRHLMYWHAVLDHLRPDVVVFPMPPHAVYDYVIYGLCDVLSIRTVMFERATFPGLVTIMGKFEDGSEDLRHAYRKILADGTPTAVLSPAAETRMQEITGDFADGMAPHMRFVVDQQKQKHHFARFRSNGGGAPPILARLGQRVAQTMRRIWQLVDIFLISGPEPWYHVKKGRKLGDTHTSRREYVSYRLAARRAKKDLRETYGRLSSKPDLSKPYIYVALQAEPERQATPCGGVFMYQYLMVDMLAKLVPEGWQVYVKEHIVGLNPHFHSERSRTPSFYEFLAAIPNVTLAPYSMTSFDLIDDAKAVATVSGSSGWEAVVRGKPTLLFGYTWYRDCEGVFNIRSEESLRDALARIADGFHVDHEKVRLFVQTLENVSARGFIDGAYAEITGIPIEENAKSLADAIGTFVGTTETGTPASTPERTL